MKYIKKPVVIEAYQFTKEMIEKHLFDGVPLPEEIKMGSAKYNREDRRIYDYRITLRGETYLVSEGDWIIKDSEGKFYSCKPDIFEATYEPVE